MPASAPGELQRKWYPSMSNSAPVAPGSNAWGTKKRGAAQLVQLVSLLLEGPQTRGDLFHALADELHDTGWGEAASSDSLSTFARDIAMIKELELLDLGPARTYKATPGAKLPLWVSPAEAHALAIAQMALDQLGIPERQAFDTLLARVPPRIRKASEHHAIALAPTLGIGDATLWRRLLDGIAQGRAMRIDYQKPDGKPLETVTLDRARITWMTGAYYLVAFRADYAAERPHEPDWRHVREYRLDRIRSVQLLSVAVSRATLPTVPVTVVLGAELRDRVLTLHDAAGRPIQTVTPLPDGTVRVRFEDCSLLRAQQRLLNFGRHLLAIESPDELREQVAAAIAELAARFPRS